MARTVHRTARIRLRPTRGQRRRLFGLLRSAGDVWALVLDCNRQLRAWGMAPVANCFALYRELVGIRFGELGVVGVRSVLQRYSQAWFEAAASRRRGEPAGFPRRKRALFPVRYYHGTFGLDGRRLRLPMPRGVPALEVRLAREAPYPAESIRSVTLLCEAGALFADVTACLPVAEAPGHELGGVDLGIIHPYAVAAGDEALVVSGRQLRAEDRLHLADTKARQRRSARRVPKKGQRGSRRWRKIRAKQRKQAARHRRKVRQAHHEAARKVVDFAVEQRVGTLVVGDPKGITDEDFGPQQNLRLRHWRRTHLLRALTDKAEAAGIEVVLVDERGTSSTCPECGARVRPKGRRFACTSCGHKGHRDVVGARNIAARGGGTTRTPARVTHRRAGTAPARRDRRRHLLDARRSCPAPGRPDAVRESLVGRSPPRDPPGVRGLGSRSAPAGHRRGLTNQAH